MFRTGSLIEQSCKTTFLGMSLLQNMRVLPHTDNSDDREGFVCMTNFGKYKGGYLLVGSDSIQYKIEYKTGDMVLFNSLGQVPPSSVGRNDKARLQLLKIGSGPPYARVFLTVECDHEHGIASPSSFNTHLIRALDDQTCPIEGDYNMNFSFRTPLVSQNHLNSPENEPSLPILREIGMLSIRIPQQGDVAAQRRELDAQHRSSVVPSNVHQATGTHAIAYKHARPPRNLGIHGLDNLPIFPLVRDIRARQHAIPPVALEPFLGLGDEPVIPVREDIDRAQRRVIRP